MSDTLIAAAIGAIAMVIVPFVQQRLNETSKRSAGPRPRVDRRALFATVASRVGAIGLLYLTDRLLIAEADRQMALGHEQLAAAAMLGAHACTVAMAIASAVTLIREMGPDWNRKNTAANGAEGHRHEELPEPTRVELPDEAGAEEDEPVHREPVPTRTKRRKKP